MTGTEKRLYELGQKLASEYEFIRSAYNSMNLDELEEINEGCNNIYFEAGFNGREPETRRAIRFGEIPKNGKSKNHASGQYENGVSCVGLLQEDEEDIKSIYDVTLGWQEIKKYIIEGTYFGGHGSDGEPLLINCKVIKEI